MDVARRPQFLLLTLVGVGAVIGGIWLSPPADASEGTLGAWWIVFTGLPTLALGVFASVRRPGHPVAVRLLAFGVLMSLEACVVAVLHRSLGGSVPTWFWAGNLIHELVIGLTIVVWADLLLRFPDGRYLRRWHPPLVAAIGAAAIAVPVALLFASPDLVHNIPHVRDGTVLTSPFASPALAGLARPLTALGEALAFVDAVVVWWLVVRFRLADPDQRRQITWLVAAVLVIVVVQVASLLLDPLLVDPASRDMVHGLAAMLSIASIPVAITVALVRHRLLDIQLVVRRSIVYGAVWALTGLAYAGAAAALGMLAGARLPVGAAVLATVAATLALEPLRRRLNRLASRRVFGQRVSGQQLLTRFGRHLEQAFDVTALAPTLANEVRSALDLEWVRITLDLGDGEHIRRQPIAAAGIGLADARVAALSAPIAHGDEVLGAIDCGPKVDGRLSADDRELLETLARQAALAVHNARLSAELAARLDEIARQARELASSRSRLVAAQDAERRRIERDLHDGIQQDLVSLIARTRMARNELRRDPAVADATLAELHVHARETLESLRELARGIHPAVLSDRGLVAAVEAKAAHLPIGVHIDVAPEADNRRFPDAVEAALYFAVAEALTNVVKHAGTTAATVRIGLPGDALVVEVSDDGRGFDPARTGRTGLAGLTDRLEAVGGHLEVVSHPGVGTTVVATVPVTASRDAFA